MPFQYCQNRLNMQVVGSSSALTSQTISCSGTPWGQPSSAGRTTNGKTDALFILHDFSWHNWLDSQPNSGLDSRCPLQTLQRALLAVHQLCLHMFPRQLASLLPGLCDSHICCELMFMHAPAALLPASTSRASCQQPRASDFLILMFFRVQVAFLAFRQVDHASSASLVDYFQVLQCLTTMHGIMQASCRTCEPQRPHGTHSFCTATWAGATAPCCWTYKCSQ